jgi:hypothetical protein
MQPLEVCSINEGIVRDKVGESKWIEISEDSFL